MSEIIARFRCIAVNFLKLILIEAILLLVIQCLIATFLDAVIVGCIFIKISKPKNRTDTIIFSDKDSSDSKLKITFDNFRVENFFDERNRYVELTELSWKACLAQRDGKYCLMFRVGNLRNSLIVQCKIRAKFVKSRQTKKWS